MIDVEDSVAIATSRVEELSPDADPDTQHASENDILPGCVITHDGAVVHPTIKEIIEGAS